MKRRIALLLAVAMLGMFAAFGAYANTPEEDARALVEETVAVLKSGTYTVQTSQEESGGYRFYSTIVADKGRFALETYSDHHWSDLSSSGKIGRFFHGKRLRRISLSGEAFHYWNYPDKKIYTTKDGRYDTHPMITELTQINPEELVAKTSGDYIIATLPAGVHLQFAQHLWYRGGKLEKITVERVKSDCRCGQPYFSRAIEFFSPEVDESFFKPVGFQLPPFLWNIRERVYRFFIKLPIAR